jgi:hypothetical protein
MNGLHDYCLHECNEEDFVFVDTEETSERKSQVKTELEI